MGDLRRVTATVSGRVQGVGFRYWASREADRLSLSGWVVNRADGTVETEAEGDAVAVDAYLSWLAHGPRGAGVTRVDAADVPPRQETGFRIRQ